MATITILDGHPYFQCVKPAVWLQDWNGKWTVRWRDFHAVKQDREFDTEQQAKTFAKTICLPPLTVDDEGCDLGDAHRFWSDLSAADA